MDIEDDENGDDDDDLYDDNETDVDNGDSDLDDSGVDRKNVDDAVGNSDDADKNNKDEGNVNDVADREGNDDSFNDAVTLVITIDVVIVFVSSALVCAVAILFSPILVLLGSSVMFTDEVWGINMVVDKFTEDFCIEGELVEDKNETVLDMFVVFHDDAINVVDDGGTEDWLTENALVVDDEDKKAVLDFSAVKNEEAEDAKVIEELGVAQSTGDNVEKLDIKDRLDIVEKIDEFCV